MLTSASTPNIVAWVGLDWADRQHLVRLQAVGSPQVESFMLEQKPEALQAWVGELRRRAYEAELASWARVAVPLAAAMNSIKGEVNVITKRRGWESPLEASLLDNNIDRQTLDAMLASVQAAAK